MENRQPGQTFLACETESGITYTVKGNGIHKGWIKERVKDGSLVSGESVLSFPAGTSRDSIKSEITTPSPPGLEKKKKNGRNLAIVQEQDSRSVLVVRVSALDAATTGDAASLSDSVFGTSGDPVNLRSQYQACSYNKFNFNPATGSPDIVNGVTEVSIDITVAGVDDATVRTAVDNALATKFGSSWFNLYDHYMYCLPPGTAGGWIAYAYINSKKSVFNDNWCTYVSGQMHELGKYNDLNTLISDVGDIDSWKNCDLNS